MTHFLPIHDIQSQLNDATAEFLTQSTALKQERLKLKEDVVRALERRMIADIEKKLHE